MNDLFFDRTKDIIYVLADYKVIGYNTTYHIVIPPINLEIETDMFSCTKL